MCTDMGVGTRGSLLSLTPTAAHAFHRTLLPYFTPASPCQSRLSKFLHNLPRNTQLLRATYLSHPLLCCFPAPLAGAPLCTSPVHVMLTQAWTGTLPSACEHRRVSSARRRLPAPQCQLRLSGTGSTWRDGGVSMRRTKPRGGKRPSSLLCLRMW